MPTATPSTYFSSTFAFFKETTIGQPPGYTTSLPQGTQSGWQTAVNAGNPTSARLRVFEADPYFVRTSNIEDPALTTGPFTKNAPIPGLNSVEGGTLSIGLHGSEAETADASQVSLTTLMEMLQHSLGGIHRSNTTTLSAVSAPNYTLDSDTNYAAGQIIALEDADNLGTLYAARVESLASSVFTIDELPDFTLAVSDACHGAATIFPQASNLIKGGTDHSTYSLLWLKGNKVIEATGARLQLDSIQFPRNEQPKINFSVKAARGFPWSSSNSIAFPTFTSTIAGQPGKPIGRKTVMRISEYGTNSYVCIPVESVEFEPGIETTFLPTVTQCDGATEGIAGFSFTPGDAILRVNLYMDGDHQDWFTDSQELEVTYEYQGAPGESWCIKLPKCRLNSSPEPSEGEGSLMDTLEFVALENSGSTDMLTAHFLIGIY